MRRIPSWALIDTWCLTFTSWNSYYKNKPYFTLLLPFMLATVLFKRHVHQEHGSQLFGTFRYTTFKYLV